MNDDRTDTPLPPSVQRGRPQPARWGILIGIWMIVFLLMWTVVAPGLQRPLRDPAYVPRTISPRSDLGNLEQTVIDVFRNASPSVVFITNIDYRRRSIFSLDVFKIQQGTGSGFVYDKQGHIVTNYHVIHGSRELEVILGDGSAWSASVVGLAPEKDIAVLRIDAPPDKLQPLPLGTSHDLQVGQTVLAIGNPFGLDHTLTTGVVSALGREIESMTGRKIRDVVQTDAAINPGNSGGPLLDSAGRLIGVNTQIASPSGGSAGVGFAVPSDIVNGIVPDLIRFGAVVRPWLGISAYNDYTARRLGIDGVLIETVASGSGAAIAKLRGTTVDSQGRASRLGDIILKINNDRVRTLIQLQDALDRYQSGDSVTVTYTRDDQVHTTSVVLRDLEPVVER